MKEYTLYSVGSKNDFIKAETIKSPDDAGAIELAKQLIDAHDVELWRRTRKVAVFSRKQDR